MKGAWTGTSANGVRQSKFMMIDGATENRWGAKYPQYATSCQNCYNVSGKLTQREKDKNWQSKILN